VKETLWFLSATATSRRAIAFYWAIPFGIDQYLATVFEISKN